MLDTPILPGSVIKTVTLVAALESQVIEPETARLCRRTVTVDGRRYVCSHPDLKRPLTPAEALAHSCNDFFVSLAHPAAARRRSMPCAQRAGCRRSPPTRTTPRPSSVSMARACTPRALLDVISRLAGVDRDRPMRDDGVDAPRAARGPARRRTIRDGIGVRRRGLTALAKTGTAPMPGGSFLGIVVALEPADAPDPRRRRRDARRRRPRRRVDRRGPSGGAARAAPAPPQLQAPPRAAQPPAPVHRRDRRVRIGPSTGADRRRSSRSDLEDYVARVLAGEGQPRAADGGTGGAGDHGSNVRTRQPRIGIAARVSTSATRRIARCFARRPKRRGARPRRRAGQVLLHDGQPATVFYSALCGGKSELASEVWPGSVDYAERAADRRRRAPASPAGRANYARHRSSARCVLQAYAAIGCATFACSQRNASGRVSRLRRRGLHAGRNLRQRLPHGVGRVAGWQLIKSTTFDVERTASGYRFPAAGFGHGVGLCVIGAGNRAASRRHGRRDPAFYFPDVAGRACTRTAITAAASTAATSTVDRPRRLPPTETARAAARMSGRCAGRRRERAVAAGRSGSRGARLDCLGDARRRARVDPRDGPSHGGSVRARDGTALVGVRRDRRHLDRSAAAHDSPSARPDRSHDPPRGRARPARRDAPQATALGARRRGLLFRRSRRPQPSSAATTSCPKDDEFLRPLSAGAHRAAYARAEACFRKAMANGKTWSEVR